jgi:hypothetical protein
MLHLQKLKLVKNNALKCIPKKILQHLVTLRPTKVSRTVLMQTHSMADIVNQPSL